MQANCFLDSCLGWQSMLSRLNHEKCGFTLVEKLILPCSRVFCSELCTSVGIIIENVKAEVRAVRDGTTMVQVGDTVVSVDEHPISELQTADQVETLLRSATALVLRRRNCSHSCGSSFIVNDSRLPVANKTHSMDRISEPTSSNTLNNVSDYLGLSLIIYFTLSLSFSLSLICCQYFYSIYFYV